MDGINGNVIEMAEVRRSREADSYRFLSRSRKCEIPEGTEQFASGIVEIFAVRMTREEEKARSIPAGSEGRKIGKRR